MDEVISEGNPCAVGVAERRKLSWGAVVAGVFTTLGLQVFMMYLGTALGASTLDPYTMAQNQDASYALPIIFLLITALFSSFAGSWVAGHWANLYSAEDSFIHGALTWSLSAVLLTAGIGALFQMGTSATQAGAQAAQVTAMTDGPGTVRGQAQAIGEVLNFDSLEDPRFSQFVLNRARTWESQQSQRRAEEPVSVSAIPAEQRQSSRQAAAQRKKEEKLKVDPGDVAKNDDLIEYVAANSNMTEDQAKQFVESNKESIARAQEESLGRWEQQHRQELAQAERVQKATSTIAWTMTGLSLLALAASLGGSYVGWRQRYHIYDEQALASDTNVI